jgi:hypothetical protein
LWPVYSILSERPSSSLQVRFAQRYFHNRNGAPDLARRRPALSEDWHAAKNPS